MDAAIGRAQRFGLIGGGRLTAGLALGCSDRIGIGECSASAYVNGVGRFKPQAPSDTGGVLQRLSKFILGEFEMCDRRAMLQFLSSATFAHEQDRFTGHMIWVRLSQRVGGFHAGIAAGIVFWA